ncbi:tyrosine-type recombinase/integrase [Tissierella praeacuta]|uniref:tyrosine-type recombinase/integrase n=1 Tax=Tissierella praeacuta TaxID=43131 RepID=UPI003511C39B
MDYINIFRDYLKTQGRSDNTIDSYIRDILQFQRFYDAKNNAELSSAIQLDIVEYKKYLQKQDYKVATINRKLVSLNIFFKFMFDSNYINNNISIETIEDKDDKEFKGLEDEEIWKLRKEIHRFGNERDICIFEILANTGIRVSELVDIKLNDIDISERKGELIIREGKGDSKRTLPLNKDARVAIDNYIEVRKADNDYLLQGQRGRMTRKGIDTMLKKYGDRLGIEVSAHRIRHTLAYKLIRNGSVGITTVKNILGHNDIQTTLIYTQTTEKDKREALDNLEW